LQLDQIDEQHEQLVVVSLADGAEKGRRQAFELLRRAKQVGTLPVEKRGGMRDVVLAEEAFEMGAELSVVLEQQLQAAGTQVVALGKQGGHLLAHPRRSPLSRREKQRQRIAPEGAPRRKEDAGQNDKPERDRIQHRHAENVK